MLFFSFSIDQDVINIDNDSFIDQITKNMVHELLKDGGCITQAPRYNCELKCPIPSLKSHFLLMSCRNTNQIIAILQVKFCEPAQHGPLGWSSEEEDIG